MRWRLPAISRRARWAALGAAVLVGGGWLLAARSRANGGGWVEARLGDVILSVEITGTLKAVESDLIGPPQIPDVWDYKISFLAPEGSKVTPGKPVLGFDTSQLARELETKLVERDSARKTIEKREGELLMGDHDDDLRLAEAEARLRKATLLASRPAELVASKAIRQVELDKELADKEVAYYRDKRVSQKSAAAAELAALRDTEQRAANRVAQIQDAMAQMTVKAPRAGTVIYLTNWRDEKKKVGDSCWRGEKILEIPDMQHMMAKAEVDEADSGKIALAQRAAFRLDAHPDVEFTGEISALSKAVEPKPARTDLKIMRAEIRLARTDPERMRPGMRFRGTIETGRVRDVLVLPLEAVLPTPSGPTVYRGTPLGLAATPITLGVRNGTVVAVTGGLKEGDRVALRAPAGAAASSDKGGGAR